MSGLGLRLAFSTRSGTHLIRFQSRWGARNLHKAPALPYAIEEGLGDFLPPPALKTVAEEYQGGLLERLNDEVRGTEFENQNLVDTIINTSDKLDLTLAFNYASLALNNGYFLDQLKPPARDAANHQSDISTHLAQSIREQHGSVAQLKSAFSAAASGLFTNGYIWFVTDANGNTGILPTLGPGTLLIRSRMYTGHDSWTDTLNQATFLADAEDITADIQNFAEVGSEEGGSAAPLSHPTPPGVAPQSPVSGMAGARTPEPPKNLNPRFMHTSARRSQVGRKEVEDEVEVRFNYRGDIPVEDQALYERDNIYAESEEVQKPQEPVSKVQAINTGEVLYPLFCLPVHEHAWMAAGYGVWGKEEWLKKFWSVLDWQKVSRQYDSIHKDPYRMST